MVGHDGSLSYRKYLRKFVKNYLSISIFEVSELEISRIKKTCDRVKTIYCQL